MKIEERPHVSASRAPTIEAGTRDGSTALDAEFSDARYIMARREFEAAEAGPGKADARSLPIVGASRTVLVDMDFELDGEVRLKPSTGHSSGKRSHSDLKAWTPCFPATPRPMQCINPDRSFRFDSDFPTRRI